MNVVCYIIAIIAAILSAFGVHPNSTLSLAVAFIAAGLLLSSVFGATVFPRRA